MSEIYELNKGETKLLPTNAIVKILFNNIIIKTINTAEKDQAGTFGRIDFMGLFLINNVFTRLFSRTHFDINYDAGVYSIKCYGRNGLEIIVEQKKNPGIRNRLNIFIKNLVDSITLRYYPDSIINAS